MSHIVDIDSDLTVRLDVLPDYTRVRWSSSPKMDRATVLRWTRAARARAADRVKLLDLVIEALTSDAPSGREGGG